MAFGASHEGELNGYLAPIVKLLAEYSLKVLEWQSIAIRDRTILAILIEIHPDHTSPLDEDLMTLAKELGIDIATEYQPFTSPSTPFAADLWHGRAILSTAQIPSSMVNSILTTLVENGANIGAVRSSNLTPTVLEVEISLLRDTSNRLASALTALQLPVALVPRNRPAPRLFLFDMDSTVINEEVIDQLALRAGKGEEVALITDSAMRGEIDFAQSLTQRVALLTDLPSSVIEEVREALTLTTGVVDLFAAIHRSGGLIAVVSGGFHNVIDPLLEQLGVDFILANTLESTDSRLTGKVIGRIIDARAKAEFLKEIATSNGISLDETVAIGDGANDREMLVLAGVGIAFCAKPTLIEVADIVISERNLALVIPLAGL